MVAEPSICRSRSLARHRAGVERDHSLSPQGVVSFGGWRGSGETDEWMVWYETLEISPSCSRTCRQVFPACSRHRRIMCSSATRQRGWRPGIEIGARRIGLAWLGDNPGIRETWRGCCRDPIRPRCASSGMPRKWSTGGGYGGGGCGTLRGKTCVCARGVGPHRSRWRALARAVDQRSSCRPNQALFEQGVVA